MLFINKAVAAPNMIGRKAPSIIVKKWVTPNPPRRANLKDRVRIVEFWATWCPSCVQAIPRMNELAEKYTKKDALFIGISVDRSIKALQNFVRQKSIKYHIAMDNNIRKKFHFEGIPKAFVISHTGKVVWQGHPQQQDFEAAIVKALKAAPKPFLDGIELGPFEQLREQLSGGRGFFKAYRTLKSKADKPDISSSQIAKVILKEIDNRIEAKIQEAEKLRTTNPAAGFELYKRLTKKFRGIEAIKPAKAAYDELKNNSKTKPTSKREVKQSD